MKIINLTQEEFKTAFPKGTPIYIIDGKMGFYTIMSFIEEAESKKGVSLMPKRIFAKFFKELTERQTELWNEDLKTFYILES